jgi:hypothetical protein
MSRRPGPTRRQATGQKYGFCRGGVSSWFYGWTACEEPAGRLCVPTSIRDLGHPWTNRSILRGRSASSQRKPSSPKKSRFWKSECRPRRTMGRSDSLRYAVERNCWVECWVSGQPDSSEETTRGGGLAAHMAKHLDAWARDHRDPTSDHIGSSASEIIWRASSFRRSNGASRARRSGCRCRTARSPTLSLSSRSLLRSRGERCIPCRGEEATAQPRARVLGSAARLDIRRRLHGVVHLWLLAHDGR